MYDTRMNLLQARRRVPVRAAQWPLRLGGGNMYRRLLCTLGSSGAGGSGGGGRSGLFGLSQLHKPSALVALATRAINRCNELLDEIQLIPPSLPSLQHIDSISDELCKVADVAELCRNVHPDPAWILASEQSYVKIVAHLAKLNTSPLVYNTLQSITENVALMSGLTLEQQRVATLLKHDMEVSGIGLPAPERARARFLLKKISSLEAEFSRNIMNESRELHLPIRLENLPESVQSVARSSLLGMGSVVSGTPGMYNTLLHFPDSSLRRQVFITYNQSAPANLSVLEELINVRHEHARLIGYPSFAHVRLAQTMTECPDEVVAFLKALSARVRPKAESEWRLLTDAKAKDRKDSTHVEAWDVRYYQHKIRSQCFPLFNSSLSAYFPLEQVLAGLSMVLERAFLCRLKELVLPPEEDWTGKGPDSTSRIRKFAVLDMANDNAVLGFIYMDLHGRRGKFGGSSHFAIRHAHDRSSEPAAVALVCSFGSGGLLPHQHVVSLFHEVGHALHSVLSRTHWQHLAGTRGPFDFVEIPSQLLEHFAYDERILSLFARHHQTGACIPRSSVHALLFARHQFIALNLQQQIVNSLLDQQLFNGKKLGASSTEILQEIQDKHSLIPFVPGTHPHTLFSHLCGYGACYHSYLSSRVIAAHIWRQFFAADPLSSVAGVRFRRMVLQPGNSTPPTQILRNYIGASSVSLKAFVENEIEKPPFS